MGKEGRGIFVGEQEGQLDLGKKKIAVSSWVRKNKDEYKRRIIKEK